jgi:hypothetical protein
MGSQLSFTKYSFHTHSDGNELMNKTNSPWYQEPYVWLVILFPASAVIGGMFTIYLAIASNDGLVIDDYYKQGLEINRILKRDKIAANYQLQATLQFNIEGHIAHLYLTAIPSYQLPNQIKLNFHHHTRAGFDESIWLERLGDNFYQGHLPALVMGKWTVELIADDWRLLKVTLMPNNQELKMRAMN